MSRSVVDGIVGIGGDWNAVAGKPVGRLEFYRLQLHDQAKTFAGSAKATPGRWGKSVSQHRDNGRSGFSCSQSFAIALNKRFDAFQ
jgi:hypothetical protein